ncbi:MAG: hypothetical protein NWQ07_08040 [Flaviramulus sp.]|nr:hypothetical protein [Flaviramulus sp.]
MKQLFFVLIFFISSHVFTQAGVYIIDNNHKHSDGTKLNWTLTLNEDGTFLYHFFRDISAISKANSAEKFYGKGTWQAEGNLVFFYTDKNTEMDDVYKINFTNSKARYITKSPRDKTDKVVNTALRFYESDLFYIKGLELFKQ